jgi:tetratricopeptide (TPR) repeat protein
VSDHAAVRWTIRVLAIGLACLALYRLIWLPYHANHLLFEVDQRTAAAQNGDALHAAPAARDNLARLQTVAAVARTDIVYHMLYAANARLLQRWDDALLHYDAALAIDHRPEIYFERGMLLVERGNADAALPDLVKATRFRPTYLDEIEGSLADRVRAALHTKSRSRASTEGWKDERLEGKPTPWPLSAFRPFSLRPRLPFPTQYAKPSAPRLLAIAKHTAIIPRPSAARCGTATGKQP